MSKLSKYKPNPNVFPLVNFIKSLNINSKELITVIAQGVIEGIKKGKISISLAEKIIFNMDVLLFCEELHDLPLKDIIEYGMELEDIQELVEDSNALPQALNEIQELLNLIYSEVSETGP